MPIKKLSEPSFIRPAEIMGGDIQAALLVKAEEIASMIATGVGQRSGNILEEARAKVSKIYKKAGLPEANRARLVRIMNEGANEVSDADALRLARPRLNKILDNVEGAVQKSADRYLDRIVLKKVAKIIAAGGSKADVEISVIKSMGDAEAYWKNVSNTATSRMFHYGSMLAAQSSGLTKCEYHAVIDSVTTDFCRAIDGQVRSLANVIKKAEDALEQTSDEMLNTTFWAMAEQMGDEGSLALVSNGITLPPFHGHCRTTTQFY